MIIDCMVVRLVYMLAGALARLNFSYLYSTLEPIARAHLGTTEKVMNSTRKIPYISGHLERVEAS